MSGGCVFKKAAESAASGGCVFKKAAESALMEGSCPVTKSAASAGVCPVSHKSAEAPPAGVCPVSHKAASEMSSGNVDDLFKKAEGMGGCPMFQATPEEAEQMRREAAQGLAAMEAAKTESQGKCPFSGQASTGGGCPMAAPGEHPELDGTWMTPVTDDPDACPTFLPRPFIEAPKHSNVKNIQADLGLSFLEKAEEDLRKEMEKTLQKVKTGEPIVLPSEKHEDKPKNEKMEESAQMKQKAVDSSFLFAHVQHIWMAGCVLLLSVVVAKMIF